MFNGNINLNLYKVFYDVAKYGSFSKAAEFTFTTQSAISKSIKKLEEELCTQLFYRNSHGVELTEKGKQLLYYVEKSYGNLLTAERIMIETKNLDRGKLNIGLPSYVASFFFFDKVVDFHNKYPNIEISLLNGSTKYLLDLLENHQIDFIIDALPVPTDNDELDIIKLYTVGYTFICKKEDYDKYKNVKSIKDLENLPLVLPVHGTNNRKYLDEIFIRENVNPTKSVNIHTSEGILNGVRRGLGIGYIISDIVKGNDDYVSLDIKENLYQCDIVIVYNKKNLSEAPIRFIEEYINLKIN